MARRVRKVCWTIEWDTVDNTVTLQGCTYDLDSTEFPGEGDKNKILNNPVANFDRTDTVDINSTNLRNAANTQEGI